jgi:hypothetical protein
MEKKQQTENTQSPLPSSEKIQQAKQKVVENLEHPRVHTTFHYISRMVIIIPILIVGLAIFISIYERQTEPSFSQTETQSQPTPTPPSSVQDMRGNPLDTILSNLGNQNAPSASTESGSIDLTGPLVCEYRQEEFELQAYIVDKQVYGELMNRSDENISYAVYQDDCVYQWKSDQQDGSQICGISDVLSLVNQFSFLQNDEQGLPIDTILPALGLSIDLSDEEKKELQQSCIQKEIPSNISFEEPASITFEEKNMMQFLEQTR